MNTNAFRLLLLNVAIYVAAYASGSRLFYYLGYVLTAVLICSWIWARLNLYDLQVRRESKALQSQVGETFEETFTVRNNSLVPKLWIEVRDHSTLPGHQAAAVISLAGKRAKRWRVRTLTRKRGLYQLGPITAISGDPFGLFRSWRTVPEMGELLVYPPTVSLESFGLPPGDLPGGTQVQQRTQAMTPNAIGLRDYIPGDPVNRIHWAASARQQQLIVKEFELDPTADLWIVLDMDRNVHITAPQAPGEKPRQAGDTRLVDLRKQDGGTPRGPANSMPIIGQTAGGPIYLEPSTEEYAVTVAASLAAYFVRGDRTVGMIASANRPVMHMPDRGARQLIKILRTLAIIRPEDPMPLAEVLAGQGTTFNRGSTVIVITSSTDEVWVPELQRLRQRGIRSVVVLVEPSTFGGPTSSMLLVGALAAVDVRTYLIKRDDALDVALAKDRPRAKLR